MKLNTKPIKGCKVLYKIPEYLGSAKVANKAKIIEMGGLYEYRQFMKFHKDCRYSKASMVDDEKFTGTKTYDTYLDLLENGDDKVMSAMKIETDKKVTELSKQYEEVIRNYRFDVVGEFFDVGLVMTGIPETWLQPEIEEEKKVRVELLLNASFHCGVNKKSVIEGASRILAITKILEDHGVQVKIKIVNCTRGYSNHKDNSEIYIATDVKNYDEPINYKKVSALVSPTSLRRGVFKVMEVVAEDTVSYGYGSPLKVDNLIDISIPKEINKLEKKLFGGKK